MKYTTNHPTLGSIVYEEDFWSGKKSLFVSGKELERKGKNTFFISGNDGGQEMTLNGNTILGASLAFGGECIEIVPRPRWYEILCSLSIFIFILIWGNSVALCSILPIIGGAIGGAVSALMAMSCLIAIKLRQKMLHKLLTWLLMLAATVLVCFAIAMAFLMIVG